MKTIEKVIQTRNNLHYLFLKLKSYEKLYFKQYLKYFDITINLK